uniref:Uncharacterized protein n=1 Tax=Heterorhabditis bacteriophora TaxID=37862 RepID=A0A1I7WKB0_HETBA
MVQGSFRRCHYGAIINDLRLN